MSDIYDPFFQVRVECAQSYESSISSLTELLVLECINGVLMNAGRGDPEHMRTDVVGVCGERVEECLLEGGSPVTQGGL